MGSARIGGRAVRSHPVLNEASVAQPKHHHILVGRVDYVSRVGRTDVQIGSDKQMHGVGRECAERILQGDWCVRFVDQDDLANIGATLSGSSQFGGCLR